MSADRSGGAGSRAPAILLSMAGTTIGLLASSTAAAAAPAAATPIDGANTAWMLICTVLVMLMTVPGIILFYSGMLRTKNALSVVAHTVIAAAVITIAWTAIGYTLAFSAGTPWLGDLRHVFAHGLIGPSVGAHAVAPTVPESVFFLFQLSFAIITFAIILGATAERMRLGATFLFSGLWLVVVYAPVAHWVWHPDGWLARMGHMDFAGGTVVHIASGASALAAAWVLGPRHGFGKEPMVPHNLLVTVLGAGLLWAGWFGFNAGSAFEASTRAAGALLATQVAACAGAVAWGLAEGLKRGQWSVLGTMTGAIAGLIGVTPASGYVDVAGALAIGAATGLVCFACVVHFKKITGIDDSLDVFALHGVGGFAGTILTPILAQADIAKVTSTSWINLFGGLVVMAYAALATWVLLRLLGFFVPLRVDATQEQVGLDIAQHGEMLSPQSR